MPGAVATPHSHARGQDVEVVARHFASELGILGAVRGEIRDACGRHPELEARRRGLTHDAQLLATELLENAIEHGAPARGVDFCFRITSREVYLEVVNGEAGSAPDDGASEGIIDAAAHEGRPEADHLAAEDYREGGRGLLMVRSLSDAWGAEEVGDHAVEVWCLIGLPKGWSA